MGASGSGDGEEGRSAAARPASTNGQRVRLRVWCAGMVVSWFHRGRSVTGPDAHAVEIVDYH